MRLRRLLVAAYHIMGTALMLPAVLRAQVPPEAEARLRANFEQGVFRVAGYPVVWSRDGRRYYRLEPAATGGGMEHVVYEAASGQRSVLLSAAQLVPPGGSASLVAESMSMSADGATVLVEARNSDDRGSVDYWLVNRNTGAMRRAVSRVSPGVAEASSFSPDGSQLRFIRARTHFALALATGQEVQLTQSNVSDSLFHDIIAWSPNGRWYAFVEFDNSPVPKRASLVADDPTFPSVRMTRYMRAGGPLPRTRVGITSTTDGTTRWIPLAAPEADFHLGETRWTSNSVELMVERYSRFRDQREYLLFNPTTGSMRSLYGESDSTWVHSLNSLVPTDANRFFRWLPGDKQFTIVTEQGGWRRALLYANDGRRIRALTPDSVDIIAPGRIDAQRGLLYYDASPDNPSQRYLYRVRLNGTGTPQRVTPTNQPGTHAYDIAPSGRLAIHTYSRFDHPPVVSLVTLPEHRTIRMLESNARAQASAKALMPGNHEFLKVDIGRGVVMDAWIMKPRDFDMNRKYPVLVSAYGQLAEALVRDDWSSRLPLHQTIADLGYVVIAMDNRGTPAPKGAAWRRAAFRQLGTLPADEVAAGVRRLATTLPYVDSTRVAIWGASGGGTLTLHAMFRHGDLFRVGIAMSAMARMDLYNAGYMEPFMRTPALNPEGYRNSSPINFAEGLRGKLLIMHGTGETNTHIQMTEQLVDRLIALGKSFDYMAYPNRDHFLAEGAGTPLHVRMLLVRYLLQHLPAGPR